MSRTLKVMAFGLAIGAIFLVFGPKADDAGAGPALDAHSGSAAQPIYPAGGSHGPSNA